MPVPRLEDSLGQRHRQAAAEPALSQEFFSAFRSLQEAVDQPWYERDDPYRFLSRETYQIIKRLFDLTLALCLLPLVLPILFLCWAAIRLDSPGPAFFRQERTGKGGGRFQMRKLRTMVIDAELLKEKYLHLNELPYPDFKITDDPRITRTGRLLRKTSLDELPQIFNIIRGEMSFVGPRPTSFPVQDYSLWHTARLEATPGLTGLWQILARCEVSFDQRLRLDIAYLRNQCLSLDLAILLRTLGCVLKGKGAA